MAHNRPWAMTPVPKIPSFSGASRRSRKKVPRESWRREGSVSSGRRGDGGDVGSGGEGGEWREGDIAGEGVWDRKGLEGGEFERGSGAGDSRGVAERVVGREVEEVGETGETLSGRAGGRGGEGVSQGGVD